MIARGQALGSEMYDLSKNQVGKDPNGNSIRSEIEHAKLQSSFAQKQENLMRSETALNREKGTFNFIDFTCSAFKFKGNQAVQRG